MVELSLTHLQDDLGVSGGVSHVLLAAAAALIHELVALGHKLGQLVALAAQQRVGEAQLATVLGWTLLGRSPLEAESRQQQHAGACHADSLSVVGSSPSQSRPAGKTGRV